MLSCKICEIFPEQVFIGCSRVKKYTTQHKLLVANATNNKSKNTQ